MVREAGSRPRRPRLDSCHARICCLVYSHADRSHTDDLKTDRSHTDSSQIDSSHTEDLRTDRSHTDSSETDISYTQVDLSE